GAGLEQLIILIRVGAFRVVGVGKIHLLWEAHILLSHKKADTSPMLFETNSKRPILPQLETSVIDAYHDAIGLMGVDVSGPIFGLAKSNFRGDAMAKELLQYEGKTIRIVGDFVAEKHVRTKRGDIMKFGTFLDAEGKFFDTVHFPQTLGRFPLRGAGLY